MIRPFLFLLSVLIAFGSSCGRSTSLDSKSNSQSEDSGLGAGPTTTLLPDEDEKIPLNEAGESFQASHAKALLKARYMEKSCRTVSDWKDWQGLPMQWCRYTLNGQKAEVLMLNPGPRRLTKWLQEACEDLSPKVEACLEAAFRQILIQSGGQFPVAGVVIEDMDGNGRGNAYAFRNGVTVRIPSFGTGTESLISQDQINHSFTDPVLATYAYARPISVTREQLSEYARASGLVLPDLGQSSEQKNVFNEVTADLYRQAWRSEQNHLLRAWIYRKYHQSLTNE